MCARRHTRACRLRACVRACERVRACLRARARVSARGLVCVRVRVRLYACIHACEKARSRLGAQLRNLLKAAEREGLRSPQRREGPHASEIARNDAWAKSREMTLEQNRAK